VVYHKTVGTGGNGDSITVGGVTRTFDNSGQNLSAADLLSICALGGTTGLEYSDGTDVLPTDVNEICSFNYIDGKWYLTAYAIDGGDYYDGHYCMVLNIIIEDVTDFNDGIVYQKVIETSLSIRGNTFVEPIMSYNDYYELMLIGLRPQNDTTPLCYVYSLDKGISWSELQELPNNISVFQANIALFVTRDPSYECVGREKFYKSIDGGTNNMITALCYDRKNSVVYVSTAKINSLATSKRGSAIESGIESVIWSPWVPLNRYNELLNNLGYINNNLYFSDVSGYGCIGSFSYAPLHKGLVVMYVGVQGMDGNNISNGDPHESWVPMLTFEEC
jgi:hypothetical protein